MHLFINEECDIPFTFLVELVTTVASDSHLCMKVKICTTSIDCMFFFNKC